MGSATRRRKRRKALTVDETAPAIPGVALTNDTGLLEQRSHHQQSGADTDQHRGGGQGRVLARRRRHLVDHAPTATQLVQGANTIDVRQTDVAGNISGVAAVTFTLDTVVPTIAITTPIAGDNIVNAAEAAAGFAINGTTTGIADGQTATIVLVNSANAVRRHLHPDRQRQCLVHHRHVDAGASAGQWQLYGQSRRVR